MELAQNHLLTALAEQTYEALIGLDSTFKIFLFNKSAEKIFKCASSKIIGMTFSELCKKIKIPCFLDAYKNDLDSITLSCDIPTLIHKLKLNWKVQKVEDNKNTFYLIRTIGLEEKTNKNEIFQLQTLIENMPCNVYWVDNHCKMIGCNQNVLTMLGMTLQDFQGKTYEELSKLCHWPEGLAQKLKNDDLSVMRSGIPIFGVEDPPLPHVNGGFSNFLTSRVPLRNNDGEIIGIAGISVDVTPLKEARAKAEAADQAKTIFIANMSHDIRTPLTGVIGLSDSLENSLENPEQKEEAHLLHDSGEELLNMLNDVLDDIESGFLSEDDIHNECFDFHQFIEDIVKLERSTIALKNLNFSVNIDKKIPTYVVSDRKKIHRILLNILGNAIKFTNTGAISVEVKCLNKKEQDIDLQFSVIDTGIGIPKNMQDKVFDRFFRILPSYKGVYKGHGLGLHIAQSYVNLLKGHIGLTSKEDAGTTFYFNIPCKKGLKKNVKRNLDRISEPQKKDISLKLNSTPTSIIIHNKSTPHLLLVEDNIMALKVLETLVTRAGYQFTSAENGEKAVELAHTLLFDLIITDIGLPGISGNEVAMKVRKLETSKDKSSIPIIGLTGHARNTALDECLASGMNDVYTKPANIELIVELVNRFVLNKNFSQKDVVNPSLSKGLGVDLPETEEELFELDKFSVFDPKSALEQVNDLALLFSIIKKAISSESQEDIHRMEEAYTRQNWTLITQLAHKLKGGAVYIGIRRMQYACQYLERYYKAGHKNLLDRLYHQLIHVNGETIETLTKWLDKYT